MGALEPQDARTPGMIRWCRDQFARIFPRRKPDPEPIAQHFVLATMTLVVAALVSLTGVDRLISGANFLVSPDAPIYADVLLGTHSRHGRPVVIVDIDENTYAAWGRPLGAPRDKLLEAVERIASARPSAIVLDVDLSLDQSSDAEAVRAFLKRWTSRADNPPLLLVRSLLPRQEDRVVPDEIDLVDSIFDEIVSNSTNARWVAGRVAAGDGGMIREWRPVLPICTRHDIRGIPSVGLAIAAINGSPRKTLSELDRLANETGRALCSGEPTDRVDPHIPALGEKLSIPFAFGADTGGGGLVDFAAESGDAVPLFSRIPIGNVLTGPAPDVGGRTVLLGATHSASRDIQRTALGLMPGVVILANIAANGSHGLAKTSWSRGAPVFGGLVGYLLGLALSVLVRPIWSKLIFFGVIVLAVFMALQFGISALYLSTAGLTMVGLSAVHVTIAQFMRSERQFGTRGHWLFTDQACTLLHLRGREKVPPPNTGDC